MTHIGVVLAHVTLRAELGHLIDPGWHRAFLRQTIVIAFMATNKLCRVKPLYIAIRHFFPVVIMISNNGSGIPCFLYLLW